MTTLRRYSLAIVLALATALLLFGFVHRCSSRTAPGGTPSASPSSFAPNDTTPMPTTTPAWLASLDWQAIGMGIGGLLTGLGTLYQIVLKWRAGAVGVDAVIDQTKVLFRDAATAQVAFKSPVTMMDKPVTMSVPPAPPETQEKPTP